MERDFSKTNGFPRQGFICMSCAHWSRGWGNIFVGSTSWISAQRWPLLWGWGGRQMAPLPTSQRKFTAGAWEEEERWHAHRTKLYIMKYQSSFCDWIPLNWEAGVEVVHSPPFGSFVPKRLTLSLCKLIKHIDNEMGVQKASCDLCRNEVKCLGEIG